MPRQLQDLILLAKFNYTWKLSCKIKESLIQVKRFITYCPILNILFPAMTLPPCLASPCHYICLVQFSVVLLYFLIFCFKIHPPGSADLADKVPPQTNFLRPPYRGWQGLNAWAGLEEESPMFVASLVGGGAPQWSQHFHNVQLSTVFIHYKLYSCKKRNPGI